MRITSTILLMIVAAAMNAAPIFYTNRLERIAGALSLKIPDPLEASMVYDNLFVYNGRPLVVETNAAEEITHIGYRLFSPESKRLIGNTPLLNFVERYLLEIRLQLDDRSMDEQLDVDRIYFSEGDILMLDKVAADTPFTVSYVERRGYNISWQLPEGAVSLYIPADCQLLMGVNAVELENLFIKKLFSYIPLDGNEIIADWESEQLSRSGNMWIVERGSYLSDLIRGDLYLVEINDKKKLYCSTRNVAKSISNIMLTGIHKNIIPMNMVVDCYGGKKTTVETTLQQFVSLCIDEGCELYFGIKNNAGGYLQGTLFALNKKQAYNHVLSVEVPATLLGDSKTVINARCYVYIPLQYVTEDFFQENITKKNL